MAIDALISAVEPHEHGVLLRLAPREGQAYVAADRETIVNPSDSIPGQPTFILLAPSWAPHVGDAIWGGACTVTIESGGISFPYRRVGYTRLIEEWPRG